MYLLLKFIHVLTVVVFLGNIAAGLFWHGFAARERDPKLLAHVLAGIIRSDRLFTVPGVIGVIFSGVATAIYGGMPILRTGWIAWTIALFVISGVVFAVRVAPLQRQMLATARVGAQTAAFDYSHYRRLALRWEVWGGVALATPLIGLALMVLKPAWSFS